MPTTDQYVADLASLLSDFQGRVYLDAIDAETLFFTDLGFASIDAVVLGETLQTRYARALPFHRFMQQLMQQGATDVRVGDLALFLARELA
jgi:acyl carrier protein